MSRLRCLPMVPGRRSYRPPVYPQKIWCGAMQFIMLLSVRNGTATTGRPGRAVAGSRRNRNHRHRPSALSSAETDGSGRLSTARADTAMCAPLMIPSTP